MSILLEAIELIPLSMAHVEDIHEYASDPIVKRYIGWPLMTALSDTEAYVKTLLERQEAKTHYYASVREIQTGKIIGTMMLFNFDWEAGHGEIGYVFSPTVWGKGYGSLATKWITSYGFETLGLRKIFARIVRANRGSAGVLLKNGYEEEAVLKDLYFIEGQLHDCVYYSKLAK